MPIKGFKVFGKSIQDGIPTPDNPVPIVNVGDKGNIKVEMTGKNLWKFNKSFSSEVGRMKTFVKKGTPFILPAGTYTFSCEGTLGNTDAPLFLILEDGTEITACRILHNEVKPKKIFTIDKKAVSIEFVSSAAINTGGTISNIQIETGTVFTQYEPYKTPQTLTLKPPNGLPGIPVDSGGNYTDENGKQWVCDEIDLEHGKYVQRIKEIIIDHDSRLNDKLANYGAPEKTTIIRRFIDSDIKKNGALLCRELPRIANWNSENESVYPTETSIDFRITRERLGLGAETTTEENSAAVLKYLESHPLHCFAERSEPFEHDISLEIIEAYKTLHTNYPTTTVLNDAGAGMELTYIADTKNYVDAKIAGICTAIVKGV